MVLNINPIKTIGYVAAGAGLLVAAKKTVDCFKTAAKNVTTPTKYLGDYVTHMMSESHKTDGWFRHNFSQRSVLTKQYILNSYGNVNQKELDAAQVLQNAKNSGAKMACYNIIAHKILSDKELHSTYTALMDAKRNLTKAQAKYINEFANNDENEIESTRRQLDNNDELKLLQHEYNTYQEKFAAQLNNSQIGFDWQQLTTQSPKLSLDGLLEVTTLQATLSATAGNKDNANYKQIIADFSAYIYHVSCAANIDHQRNLIAQKYGENIEKMLFSAAFGDIESKHSIANYFMQSLQLLFDYPVADKTKSFSMKEFAIEGEDPSYKQINNSVNNSKKYSETGQKIGQEIFDYFMEFKEQVLTDEQKEKCNDDSILKANLFGGTSDKGAHQIKNKTGLLKHISDRLNAYSGNQAAEVIDKYGFNLFNNPKGKLEQNNIINLAKKQTQAKHQPQPQQLQTKDYTDLYTTKQKNAQQILDGSSKYIATLFKAPTENKVSNSLQAKITHYRDELEKAETTFKKSELIKSLQIISKDLSLMENLATFYHSYQVGDAQHNQKKMGLLNIIDPATLNLIDEETKTHIEKFIAAAKSENGNAIIKQFFNNFENADYNKALTTYNILNSIKNLNVPEYTLRIQNDPKLLTEVNNLLPQDKKITREELLSGRCLDEVMQQIRLKLEDTAFNLNDYWHNFKKQASHLNEMETMLENLSKQAQELELSTLETKLILLEQYVPESKAEIDKIRQSFKQLSEVRISNNSHDSQLKEINRLNESLNKIYQKSELATTMSDLNSKGSISKYAFIQYVSSQAQPSQLSKVRDFIINLFYGNQVVSANQTEIDKNKSNAPINVLNLIYDKYQEKNDKIKDLVDVHAQLNQQVMQFIDFIDNYQNSSTQLMANDKTNNTLVARSKAFQAMNGELAKFSEKISQLNIPGIEKIKNTTKEFIKKYNREINKSESFEQLVIKFADSDDNGKIDKGIQTQSLRLNIFDDYKKLIQGIKTSLDSIKQDNLTIGAKANYDVAQNLIIDLQTQARLFSTSFGSYQQFVDVKPVKPENSVKNLILNEIYNQRGPNHNLDLELILQTLKQNPQINVDNVDMLKAQINYVLQIYSQQQIEEFYLDCYAKFKTFEDRLDQLCQIYQNLPQNNNGFVSNETVAAIANSCRTLDHQIKRFNKIKEALQGNVLKQAIIIDSNTAKTEKNLYELLLKVNLSHYAYQYNPNPTAAAQYSLAVETMMSYINYLRISNPGAKIELTDIQDVEKCLLSIIKDTNNNADDQLTKVQTILNKWKTNLNLGQDKDIFTFISQNIIDPVINWFKRLFNNSQKENIKDIISKFQEMYPKLFEGLSAHLNFEMDKLENLTKLQQSVNKNEQKNKQEYFSVMSSFEGVSQILSKVIEVPEVAEVSTEFELIQIESDLSQVNNGVNKP